MKVVAISLTILAAAAWLCTAAIRLPWSGNKDFSWHWPGIGQLSLGLYGAGISWDAEGEFRYFDVYPAVPLIRYHVISDEAAELLRDDRAWHGDPKFDPEYRKLYDAAKERDNAKEWRIPRKSAS